MLGLALVATVLLESQGNRGDERVTMSLLEHCFIKMIVMIRCFPGAILCQAFAPPRSSQLKAKSVERVPGSDIDGVFSVSSSSMTSSQFLP